RSLSDATSPWWVARVLSKSSRSRPMTAVIAFASRALTAPLPPPVAASSNRSRKEGARGVEGSDIALVGYRNSKHECESSRLVWDFELRISDWAETKKPRAATSAAPGLQRTEVALRPWCFAP